MYNNSPNDIESNVFSLARFVDRNISYSSGGKIVFTEFLLPCIAAETLERYANGTCDLYNPDPLFDGRGNSMACLSLCTNHGKSWLVLTDDDDWIFHSPDMSYDRALKLYSRWPTIVSFDWLVSQGFH